jgi:pimeloyl-ACP methyl ester carboxylesterase
MEHKVIDSERGSVNYWVAGYSAEALVFTHGATMDHGMFSSQVEFFSERYRTITWDVPGHGLSRPYRDFTLQNAAADLFSILDQEGFQHAHLVGQSMGGYIVQVCAYAHPERVATLTTIGSSPIAATYLTRMDRFLLSITPSILRMYPYNYLVTTIARQISVTTAGKTYALETLRGLTKAEIAHIMQRVYEGIDGYTGDIPRQIPLLITYGDKDVTGKVAEYSRNWADKENHELKVIPRAAHNANVDNPQFFNQALLEFLQDERK